MIIVNNKPVHVSVNHRWTAYPSEVTERVAFLENPDGIDSLLQWVVIDDVHVIIENELTVQFESRSDASETWFATIRGEVLVVEGDDVFVAQWREAGVAVNISPPIGVERI